MTTPQSMKEEIEKLFPGITLAQIWFIVKLSKYVRLRARNNTAFNNLFSHVFPSCKFQQVVKHHMDGSTYMGLAITDGFAEITDESDES